jgi:3-phytase/alkaline phosphatase D
MKYLSIKQKRFFTILTLVLLVAMVVAPGALAMDPKGAPTPVRFASFNASLNRNFDGQLMSDLSAPGNAQADAVAEIIQLTRPDVLLINEFDYDAGGVALQGFLEHYLGKPHGDADPIDYPYTFIAPSNTGIHSGVDLNNDGFFDPVAGPFNFVYANDSFGFGWFPGQFGMAVLSRYPIDEDNIRTFQNFLWKDMPGALLPKNPDGTNFYSDAQLDIFRLSSKSHWDVPILIDGKTVHFLTSHPTPPVFDDPIIDQNGTRNHDEIRFWADYVIPSRGGYIYDDDGNQGGLEPGAMFVIAGDQNSDPFDGDSVPGSIQQLLDHPLVNTKVTPNSAGAVEQSDLQGGANETHLSDPAYDTADFSDFAPGNLRADYVLPRKNLRIVEASVFWPTSDDPLFELVGTWPFPSSDHRLVWVDVWVPSN